jgi:hypothetical protein
MPHDKSPEPIRIRRNILQHNKEAVYEKSIANIILNGGRYLRFHV